MMSRPNKTIGIKPEVLNDLASRFLINLSEDDRSDSFKLCSQMEQAHWFYLDLVRPEDPSLPACSLKEFMATIFEHCPFLVNKSMNKNLDALIAQWKSHKYKKPVRGAVILNTDLTKCLLVQGYPASTSWGFPKGKLEQGEDDVDTAVREVYEETGFDSREIIQRDLYLDATINDSHSRMYIIPGVPEDTEFEPKTRKEIGAIQWFSVDELPRHRKDMSSRVTLGKSANTFFLVIPFINQLRKWITSQTDKKPNSKRRSVSATFNTVRPPTKQTVTNKAPILPTPRYIGPNSTNSIHPIPTPHQIYHGNNIAPIPYPAPPSHPPPPTNYTLPAPLQQTQTGKFYQGTVQYTAVYPMHIAYPNKQAHTIVSFSTANDVHHSPQQTVVRSVQPYPGQITREDLFRSASNKYSGRAMMQGQLQYRPPVSKEQCVLLSPSLSMTRFRFNRELVLASAK